MTNFTEAELKDKIDPGARNILIAFLLVVAAIVGFGIYDLSNRSNELTIGAQDLSEQYDTLVTRDDYRELVRNRDIVVEINDTDYNVVLSQKSGEKVLVDVNGTPIEPAKS